eukprot:scaffold18928_cov36-Prasinocladus_malaysianus.AAC.1
MYYALSAANESVAISFIHPHSCARGDHSLTLAVAFVGSPGRAVGLFAAEGAQAGRHGRGGAAAHAQLATHSRGEPREPRGVQRRRLHAPPIPSHRSGTLPAVATTGGSSTVK